MELNINNIACHFLCCLNSLKFSHWKTKSYAEHQALGSLISYLDKWIDDVVEMYLGDTSSTEIKEPDMVFKSGQDTDSKHKISILGTWLLVNMVDLSPGLMNKRDELIGELEKTLYLLRMS